MKITKAVIKLNILLDSAHVFIRCLSTFLKLQTSASAYIT